MPHAMSEAPVLYLADNTDSSDDCLFYLTLQLVQLIDKVQYIKHVTKLQVCLDGGVEEFRTLQSRRTNSRPLLNI